MTIPTTFKALVKVALTSGYILTRHEDSHLIAIPWTEDALTGDDLVGAMFSEGDNYSHIHGVPSKKLHGRKVWHVNLGDDLFVEVSVMPRIATDSQRLIKRRQMDARNAGIYSDFISSDFSLGELSHKYGLSTLHLNGILDQLRLRRQHADAKAGLIYPELDPHKRRMKNGRGYETGYVLKYPLRGYIKAMLRPENMPVWGYRDAQKEADRLNKEIHFKGNNKA